MATQSLPRTRTKSPKGTVHAWTVQGIMPINGEWMAVVSEFTSNPGDPVISGLRRIDELAPRQRSRAERWVAQVESWGRKAI